VTPGDERGDPGDRDAQDVRPVWIDSHCHVQPPYQKGDEPVEVVLDRARTAGVGAMLCVGCDLASSQGAIELAGAHADVWATVGLHPHDASKLDDEWDALVELASGDPSGSTAPESATQAARPCRIVGIGETGFDLFYGHSPEAAQEEAFRRHIRLAHSLDLALVIHSRDAWTQTFRVLRDEGVPARTMFHCFTGGPAEAEEALTLGAHLSFSGIVSFKTADDLRAAARLTPLDRLLVETDAPYLAPVPHRGRTNEPAFVAAVGDALAAARGATSAEIAAATARNARFVFEIEVTSSAASTLDPV
jgi:TatD DNase family protein